jgi:hypothetical protein
MTLQRFQLQMSDVDMTLQTALRREGGSAVVARERLPAEVNAFHVDPEVGRTLEQPFTDDAHVAGLWIEPLV